MANSLPHETRQQPVHSQEWAVSAGTGDAQESLSTIKKSDVWGNPKETAARRKPPELPWNKSPWSTHGSA